MCKGTLLQNYKNIWERLRFEIKPMAFLKLSDYLFKGTVSRDFRPLVFSSNSASGSTYSWAKAVSNIDSYSRR
jgi:hypothetical protein